MNLSDAYYMAKPAIPLRIRLAIRAVLASHLKQKYNHTWPINEAAAIPPPHWPGWPKGKRFAFVLTHDVEGRRGLERCGQLTDLEMQLGFRSAFNFVPEGQYRLPESFREFLTAKGFEVGVHDLHHDGTLYRSWDGFRSGTRKINQYLKQWGALGFRSGFMRHNLDWLGELDVLYDSSTFDTDPFEPQPDGVNTIFPFWVSRDGEHGYVEIPYTLPQDSTLFLLLKEQSIAIWKRKLDWIAQHGGLALVIVHPDYLSFSGQKREGEYSVHLYRELLDYVRVRYGDQCWLALPNEVAKYFYRTMIASSGVNRRFHAEQFGAITSLQREEPGGEFPGVPQTIAPGSADATARLSCLKGKHMAVVSYSHFPGDPRPRRAAEAFVQAGMSVEVICLMDDGMAQREKFNGIEILRIASRHERGTPLNYVLRYCRFIATTFAILAGRSLRRRYDAVHIHNMPDILVLAALVPKFLGAKVILDLHDPMPELMRTIYKQQHDSVAVRLVGLCEKWSIALADAVFTVNRACEKLFISRSCSPEKISVVMNAPDEAIFKYIPAIGMVRREDEANAPFVIMYHGTLVERNGVDLAVEALATVRKSVPGAELRIYGPRTPFLDRIMLSASEQGLDKAVLYLGPRRLEQLVQAIGECDVGVIPNKRSIFTEINTPTRIFEYLALGKHVVAPRAPGIQDYFSEDSLVLFDLGNAEDLAAQLVWVANHPREVLEITRRGQTVYRKHAWNKERDKLLRRAVNLLSNGDHAEC